MIEEIHRFSKAVGTQTPSIPKKVTSEHNIRGTDMEYEYNAIWFCFGGPLRCTNAVHIT